MTIPANLLFAGELLTTGLGIAAELQAGEIESQALKTQVEQEKLNAQIRSNERKQRLLSSMAANNAALGARGITVEGSPTTILQADYKAASREAEADLLSTRINTLSLMSRAKSARQLSKLRAGTSLLTKTIDIAKTGV